MPDEKKRLIHLQLFQGVDIEPIQSLILASQYRTYTAGTAVLSPERENHEMMVILSGRLAVQLDLDDDEPLVSLCAGDSVGEMSVFDGKNPSAYVVALEVTELLVISRELLWQMINASHGVARNLLHLLSCRVRAGNAAVTDSRQLQREYERHAHLDPLTGLHNRRWLEALFQRLQYVSTAELPTVIMIDVDHFKRFNDEFGHVAGDHALKAVANAMKHSLRPMDMLARYGGEEFVVVLPRTVLEQGARVAERIRLNVAATPIDVPTLPELPSITISLGLAEMQPGEDLETLMVRADDALYAAKGAGRNQIVAGSSL